MLFNNFMKQYEVEPARAAFVGQTISCEKVAETIGLACRSEVERFA